MLAGTRGGGLLGDRPATARAGGTFGGGGSPGFGFGGSRPASAPRERPGGNSMPAIKVGLVHSHGWLCCH